MLFMLCFLKVFVVLMCLFFSLFSNLEFSEVVIVGMVMESFVVCWMVYLLVFFDLVLFSILFKSLFWFLLFFMVKMLVLILMSKFFSFFLFYLVKVLCSLVLVSLLVDFKML